MGGGAPLHERRIAGQDPHTVIDGVEPEEVKELAAAG
jgi:hypothetical protein